MSISDLPAADGLYDPRNEHDACGVAMVARLDNKPTHATIVRALTALDNLQHRGGEGADINTGDGAGILTQIPDALLRSVVPFELPPRGDYGVGMCFLPRDDARRRQIVDLIELNVRVEGQRMLGWRTVPIDSDHVGAAAERARPEIMQCFIGRGEACVDQEAFERKLYVIRRIVENAITVDFYAASFSSRTIVYKGMLTSPQLGRFYPDLTDERYASALALVHSRFSTNTFPSWQLAHPFRLICHNGEINTLMGNINWMAARESRLASALFGLDLQKVLPVVRPSGSDSATFDNVLELLMLAGRRLPHAAMMMIPEAYAGRDDLPDHLKGFYAFHSCLMEPWDGPASVCFTDGRTVGATLDRNGLRPGRWVQTTDGYVALGSETGMLPVAPEEIVRRGRLAPGKLFLVDLEAGRIVEDAEIKQQVATQRPYGDWYAANALDFADLPPATPKPLAHEIERLQRAHGYSQEDLRVLLAPMAASGAEPIGSMGNDASLAVLSDRQPSLFGYFKQLFAQVTNPPIDPIRESLVMSLRTAIGPAQNLFDETPAHARQIILRQPILLDTELETLRRIEHRHFRAHTLDITWPREQGAEGLAARIARLCDEAYDSVAAGANILILSDRATGPERVPVPALLATAAIHHHLVRSGTRLQAGLVVESAEPREVHHVATLIGYGASAINPYLMFAAVDRLVAEGRVEAVDDPALARANIVAALGKGLLKTISKMGISTIQSYGGAQIFEAVGLSRAVIDRHFVGTASRIGGVDIEQLGAQAIARHRLGFGDGGAQPGRQLPVGGLYAWRREGEHHMWNPETITALQRAVRSDGDSAQARYDRYAQIVNSSATKRATLRGLMTFDSAAADPIALDRVEPASEIVKRFATGAMSLGSISTEAHENLAIAMNRLGGRSNTGEGGEDERRFIRDLNGDLRRSAIKQVASGRFGVTSHYLVNADQLQIKMAQGAKPGEGGQLPGHKVDDYIGSVRHTTPGVGLISPPPHHDIYSIEDLKQLIYDLRCANPVAQVSVKLVAEIGVGTIAAGVAKANADHVVIAGHDGGTGASPLSSIVGAGVPWEIGLAETQQTLLKNDLRRRIVVQTDGQLKTGRDVVIAALLGADEMGFSTAPLIASGCIMMRACHLNTCPVGIATQDPELRRRFDGKPEQIVNYFFFVAEEARRIMASLGIDRFDDLIGRVDLLRADAAIDHYRRRGIDLSGLLAFPAAVAADAPRRRVEGPPPVLSDALDHRLIAQARSVLEDGAQAVKIGVAVRNTDRCVGGLLSSQISRLHGREGLPEDAIEVQLTGSAGQSFAGWLARGVTFTLSGDANDYVGKGLSGGTVAIRPPGGVKFAAADNVIAGNTCLYGATAGKAFFSGQVGERFAVRNSGALAVVEGVGDHGCEYMTGGRVVVLGQVGRNFAAGMSGGLAFVYDPDRTFSQRVNPTMVDQLEPLTDRDADELLALIAEHARRTGSTLASRILADWDNERERFIKVYPRDYKRVVQRQELPPIAAAVAAADRSRQEEA